MDLSITRSSHVVFFQGLGEGRKMAAQHLQLSALDFVRIFEQSAWRRTGGMRSVLIERSSMAWTHKQPRFLKPANRAAEMGAVDRKNLERFRIDPAHPAWNFS